MSIATVQLPSGKIVDVEVPQGASDNDIHNFVMSQFPEESNSQPQQNPGLLEQAGQFAQGLPQAFGNKFIGAVQSATGAIAPDSQFAHNLAQQVSNLKQRQAALSPAERAGIATGEVAADIGLTAASPLTRGAGFVANAAGGGLISGLTTPLEDSSNQARLGEVGKDAALGAAFGKGAQLLGQGASTAGQGVKNIVKGVNAGIPEELAVIGNGLKKKASSLYQEVRDSGTVLRPQATGQIVKSLEKALTKDGESLAPHLHGDTLKSIEFIKEDIAKKNNLISLPELDQYRQLLNQTIKKNTTKLDGANPDAYKSILVKDQLDRIVKTLSPKYLIQSGNPNAIKILDAARNQWGTAAKFEKISDIVEKADGDPNRIKSLLKNFVTNKANLKGYTKSEVDALREAARNSTGEKLLKLGGKFGLDLGSSLSTGNTALPAIAAGTIGAFKGASSGGITLAIGTAARQAQKYIARGKLDEALNLIQSSGNPSKVIAKIPNRKLQEKLINNILSRGSGAVAAESNNDTNQ